MGVDRFRTIVEEAAFTDQLRALGDPKEFDEQLRGLMWLLCRNPEGFDPVPCFAPLRIAKTESGSRRPFSLRLLFEVAEDLSVHLIAIKKVAHQK